MKRFEIEDRFTGRVSAGDATRYYACERRNFRNDANHLSRVSRARQFSIYSRKRYRLTMDRALSVYTYVSFIFALARTLVFSEEDHSPLRRYLGNKSEVKRVTSHARTRVHSQMYFGYYTIGERERGGDVRIPKEHAKRALAFRYRKLRDIDLSHGIYAPEYRGTYIAELFPPARNSSSSRMFDYLSTFECNCLQLYCCLFKNGRDIAQLLFRLMFVGSLGRILVTWLIEI